ncbi:flavin-containing monooxygenase [Corynebacterium camporealensis]
MAANQELKSRYEEERIKRLRAEGVGQFTNLEGVIDPEHQDPFKEVEDRAPVHDDVEFTFVGGGWAGLMTGARLKEAGINVRYVEKAGGFGGVWYWNRYPGLMCDTSSLIYLPFLEETKYTPTEFYAHGPEILEHANRIAKQYDLGENSLFHTRVTEVEWSEDKKRWIVRTARGDEFTTKFLALGLGALHVAKLPNFPGIEDFKGDWFHTSRWDYSVTGGSATEPMDKLKDKRVAVIGTGATSVQIVPELGRDAKELLVFQRTPTAVSARDNGPLHYDWLEEMQSEPGWQEKLYNHFLEWYEDWRFGSGILNEEHTPNWINDAWTNTGELVAGYLKEYKPKNKEEARKALYAADEELSGKVRARVDGIVEDEKTAELLKAWYPFWCKRPGYHDEYLPTFNRDNVHLVDTDGKGVERITEKGIVANGKEYAVDVIIYATGFQYNRDLSRVPGVKIIGRDGLALDDFWEEGLQTLHGFQVNGYPNLFLQQSIQAAYLASNVPQNYVYSSKAIRDLVSKARENNYDIIEPTKEAQDKWVHFLEENSSPNDDPECTPGYYNDEGKAPGKREQRSVGYPYGPTAFFKYFENWREEGYDGLQFA